MIMHLPAEHGVFRPSLLPVLAMLSMGRSRANGDMAYLWREFPRGMKNSLQETVFRPEKRIFRREKSQATAGVAARSE